VSASIFDERYYLIYEDPPLATEVPGKDDRINERGIALFYTLSTPLIFATKMWKGEGVRHRDGDDKDTESKAPVLCPSE
jgi:hypothetical protein